MTLSVYAIQSDAGPIKIGVSGAPNERLGQIVACQPFDARVIHVVSDEAVCAFTVEKIAHLLLSEFRKRGEWFNITPDQAVEALQVALDLARDGLAAKRPGDDTRIITPIPASLLAAIDDYRFSRRIASRAETIRQLIALGLATAARPAAAPPSPAARKP